MCCALFPLEANPFELWKFTQQIMFGRWFKDEAVEERRLLTEEVESNCTPVCQSRSGSAHRLLQHNCDWPADRANEWQYLKGEPLDSPCSAELTVALPYFASCPTWVMAGGPKQQYDSLIIQITVWKTKIPEVRNDARYLMVQGSNKNLLSDAS